MWDFAFTVAKTATSTGSQYIWVIWILLVYRTSYSVRREWRVKDTRPVLTDDLIMVNIWAQRVTMYKIPAWHLRAGARISPIQRLWRRSVLSAGCFFSGWNNVLFNDKPNCSSLILVGIMHMWWLQSWHFILQQSCYRKWKIFFLHIPHIVPRTRTQLSASYSFSYLGLF